LLASAITREEEGEYPLSLQKAAGGSNNWIAECGGPQAQEQGRKPAYGKRTSTTGSAWHASTWTTFAYDLARQDLQRVLQLRPKESRARQLLSEIDQREQEYLRMRQEKGATLPIRGDAYQNGEVTGALSKLERLLELDHRAPDVSGTAPGSAYQALYNKVGPSTRASRTPMGKLAGSWSTGTSQPHWHLATNI